MGGLLSWQFTILAKIQAFFKNPSTFSKFQALFKKFQAFFQKVQVFFQNPSFFAKIVNHQDSNPTI